VNKSVKAENGPGSVPERKLQIKRGQGRTHKNNAVRGKRKKQRKQRDNRIDQPVPMSRVALRGTGSRLNLAKKRRNEKNWYAQNVVAKKKKKRENTGENGKRKKKKRDPQLVTIIISLQA